jgi:hypothetical protein
VPLLTRSAGEKNVGLKMQYTTKKIMTCGDGVQNNGVVLSDDQENNHSDEVHDGESKRTKDTMQYNTK